MVHPEEEPHGRERQPGDTAPISDVDAYHDNLRMHGTVESSLDRSKIFRYPKDANALRAEARERVDRERPITMLIVGVGNGEEPLSYLSALRSELHSTGGTLQRSVDMHLVDIRPHEDINVQYGLGQVAGGVLGKAFLSAVPGAAGRMVPAEPPKGMDDAFTLNADGKEYVFHEDIRGAFEAAMADPERAHFRMPVENFVAREPATMRFDIVACNNVLQHLGGIEGYASPFKNPATDPNEDSPDYSRYIQTVRGILDRVAPGGLLIMHTDGATPGDTKGLATQTALDLLPEFTEQFETLQRGVFRRKI